MAGELSMINMSAPIAVRALLPISVLLSGYGYFVPWIWHPASGLVVTGIDLGEYVKFLPDVRSGEVTVWREGFYIPLVAITLICTLSAYRREFRYSAWLRALLIAIGVAASLNLLPPAWTPGRMLQPEFRLQLVALLAGLVLCALSPLWAYIPLRIYQTAILLGCSAAVVLPAIEVIDILPMLQNLYQAPMSLGVGLWLLSAGYAGVGASVLLVTQPNYFSHLLWRIKQERGHVATRSNPNT